MGKIISTPGGRTSYGVVSFDDSMAPVNRTPEDAKKLVELERLLKSKAKFELLCSAACQAYLSGLRRSDRRRNMGHELISLMQGLNEYPTRRRKSEK